MPLVFGAQRFSLAGDMAVPPSGLTSGVADSMSWANGQGLGLYHGASQSDDRRSRQRRALRLLGEVESDVVDDSIENEESASGSDGSYELSKKRLPDELHSLLDQLLTFGVGFAICTTIQIIGLLCWRYRCNRRYCASKGPPSAMLTF